MRTHAVKWCPDLFGPNQNGCTGVTMHMERNRLMSRNDSKSLRLAPKTAALSQNRPQLLWNDAVITEVVLDMVFESYLAAGGACAQNLGAHCREKTPSQKTFPHLPVLPVKHMPASLADAVARQGCPSISSLIVKRCISSALCLASWQPHVPWPLHCNVDKALDRSRLLLHQAS